MKYLVFFLCIISLSLQAQRARDDIRGAAATASRGVAGNRQMPPDSLKWKLGGDVSLNFSQVSFSNWAGGGDNSMSVSTSTNLFANYKKDKIIWENYSFMTYGTIKTGKKQPIKNTDQIVAGSKIGLQQSKNWYYTAAVLGRTQFSPGFINDNKDRVSDFLAPLNVFVSLGMDYKPSSSLSVNLSPAMGKATYVRSTNPRILAAGGIPEDRRDKGKDTYYEFGG